MGDIPRNSNSPQDVILVAEGAHMEQPFFVYFGGSGGRYGWHCSSQLFLRLEVKDMQAHAVMPHAGSDEADRFAGLTLVHCVIPFVEPAAGMCKYGIERRMQ